MDNVQTNPQKSANVESDENGDLGKHLLVLQDVGGDKVEQTLVGGQLDWHGGAYQGEVLVGAGNLENTRSQGDCSLEANSATKQTWQSVRSRNLCSSARKIW